jgi:hypothetical protein
MIARHGPGLCSDARRCEGLLRDLCGEHRREINILVGALRERVPLDLLAARNSVPSALLLTRLAKRLEDHLALTEGASQWAVDSWALALGVVSDAELSEMKRRRDETALAGVEASKTPAAPRPTLGGEVAAERPAASSGTPPPAAPPGPLPTQTPSASKPVGPQSPSTVSTRQPAQGSSIAAARQGPVAQPPTLPRSANTGGLQTPSADPAPASGRGRWRGCLVGCFLLILLSALLIVGAPYVLNILREEQQQRSLEPPPAQTR